MMARTLGAGTPYKDIMEWNVERFFHNVKTRQSTHFKFERHESYLELNYSISEALAACDIHQLSYLEIELHTVDLSEIHHFSEPIYFKGGFISLNGDVYLSKKGCTDDFKGCRFLVMSCYKLCTFAPPQNVPELVPEDILTFRLVWSYNEDLLDCMMMKCGTSPHQIKEKTLGMPLKTLSKNFESFFKSRIESRTERRTKSETKSETKSKTEPDFTVMVGDKRFKVHPAVLSDRSDVFEAMFQHDTLEKRNEMVNISNVSAKIMREVLYYVYSGEIRRLDPETAHKLFDVADKYLLMGMKDDCLNFIQDNLTIENIVDAIILVHIYNVSSLENKIIQFIADNAEELQKSNAWKEFSKKMPSIGMKYLHSALILSVKYNKAQ